MTILALDVGDRRIGLAVSDPTELVARPVTVINRQSNLLDAEAVRRHVDSSGARLIVVGLPLASDDLPGPQARRTKAFVRYLRKALPVPVETWDERFSTIDAQNELLAQGIRRSRRKGLLDAAAAAVILDEWLTSRRSRTTAPEPT